jgi:hypothetical protein
LFRNVRTVLAYRPCRLFEKCIRRLRVRRALSSTNTDDLWLSTCMSVIFLWVRLTRTKLDDMKELTRYFRQRPVASAPKPMVAECLKASSACSGIWPVKFIKTHLMVKECYSNLMLALRRRGFVRTVCLIFLRPRNPIVFDC